MIKLNKIEGTDIFEFAIEGNVDKEGVENFYKLLEIKAAEHQKIKLLGTIQEFPGFEDFGALWGTVKMKAKAIANLDKFAVLSGKQLLETILPIGNFLTPGIPMKHFDLAEREQAVAWLKKDEVKTVPEEEYLSKMNVEKIKGSNIYTFTLNGKIDEGGMTALYNILKDKTREGKTNLLAYIEHFDGFDSFKALTEGLKVDYASFGNIDKFAIVSDKKWINNIAEIESKILPGISMKGFAKDEENKAMAWLQD